MRVKTEAKRHEILAAAAIEFRQRGYHETTLTHVAERIRSSKATIYNYYRSKSELFGAMLAAAAIPATEALLHPFERAAPFTENLTAFARAYVEMHAGADAVAWQRLVIAEPEISRAVMVLFKENPETAVWSRLATIFAEQQAGAVLTKGDPVEMVRQLRILLHGDLPMRLLFHERDVVTLAEMTQSADAAAQMFLAAFTVK